MLYVIYRREAPRTNPPRPAGAWELFTGVEWTKGNKGMIKKLFTEKEVDHFMQHWVPRINFSGGELCRDGRRPSARYEFQARLVETRNGLPNT